VLLPWLEQGEAIGMQLGRNVAVGEDVSKHVAKWEEQRQALLQRPAFAEDKPSADNVPKELQTKVDMFKLRPDVQTAFQGLDWDVKVVDLQHVLSFQKVVVLENIEERVSGLKPDDMENLFSFCLPDASSSELPEPFFDTDPTGVVTGVTISSRNPNLRVIGLANIKQEISPGHTVVGYGFCINMGWPFIQVAEFHGRQFVRDGYHRCYGLMSVGIDKIPCLYIKAKTASQIGADGAGFIKYDVLFSDRPPFLKDFADDTLSATVEHPAIRRVVRIAATAFNVDV
jgi:hypothetical protein